MKALFFIIATHLLFIYSPCSAQTLPRQFTTTLEYEQSIGVHITNNKVSTKGLNPPNKQGINLISTYPIKENITLGLGIGAHFFSKQPPFKTTYIPLIASANYYPLSDNALSLSSRITYGLIDNLGNNYSIGIGVGHPLKLGSIHLIPSLGYEVISHSAYFLQSITYQEGPQQNIVEKESSSVTERSCFYTHTFTFRIGIKL